MMKKLVKRISRALSYFLFFTIMTACVSRQPQPVKEPVDSAPDVSLIDWSKVKPAIPKYEPRSRYGNPESYEQDGLKYVILKSAKGYKKEGIASWYGTKFHGRRTSSGETYDMLKMTAAHKTLPLPVYAKVTNLENGKSIIVKINDRGPFKEGRIIDLSYAAAHKLDMAKKGTVKVKVETITSFSKTQSSFQSQSVNPKVGKQTVEKNNSKGIQRYVQVGAYSVHKTAQKLAKVLDKEINLPVRITTLKRNGKNLYRVRVGPVPTEEAAQELLKILDIKELGKPQIVYQ